MSFECILDVHYGCLDSGQYFIFSAVKRLIAINHIQNKRFCLHNIYVCTVYIYYVYINTHTCMYIIKKKMLCLYIKCMYI